MPASSIVAATTKLIALQHAKSDDRLSAADGARCTWPFRAWRLGEGLRGQCLRIVRGTVAPEGAWPEWLHDLVGRTGFRPPASTKALHAPWGGARLR
jgi:hypothetical protein